MSRTLRISRDLKQCKADKAILEKYFRTTAEKIRAEIQKQREQRMKAERENARFIAAQKVDPTLTLGQHAADLFLEDLAAGKVKFASQPPERGPLVPPVTASEHKEGEPPVTASEYKATAGGRKTRRKRRRKKKKSRRKRKTRHRRKRRKTRKKRR